MMRKRALWSILLLVGLLPFEVSSLLMPGFSLTKGATVLTVLLFLWGFMVSSKREFIRESSLLWVFLLLPLVGLISLTGAWNQKAAVIEIIRLLTLWSMLAAFLWHVQREDLRTVSRVFIGVMTISAVLGILQYLTGMFFWGETLGSVTKRANSTFVDPNIFARYLIVAILFTLTELKETTVKKGPALLVLLTLFLGLGLSFSRVGWVDFLITLTLFLLVSRLIPWKHLLWGFPALLIASLAIPAIRSRLLTLQTDFTAGRDYLWKAGYWMFHDHPVRGVGIGNFQTFFENHFMYLLDGETVTR